MPFDNLQKIASPKLQKQKPRQLQQEQPIASPKAPEPQATTKPSPAGAGQVQLPQAKPQAAAPAIANNSLDPNHRSQAPSAGGAYGQQRVDTIENAPVSANFERGPAVGGSGFVNLGHLLSINRKSGQQNAKQLADKRAQAAAKAQSDLQGYQNQFENKVGAAEVFFDKSKADAAAAYTAAHPEGTGAVDEYGTTRDALTGTTTRDQQLDPSTSQYTDASWLDSQASKASAGYKGPTGIGAMEGFGDFEKGYKNTADSVSNLTKGNEGIAAEIAKDTGLSGKQSSMSAFYSGADNEDLVGVGKKYSNLGSMLDKANQSSRERAQLAKDRTAAAKGLYEGAAGKRREQSEADAAAERGRQAAITKIEGDDNRYTSTGPEQNRVETDRVEQQDNSANKTTGNEDLNYIDDENWAQQHGHTYDEWVAMGSPMTESQYEEAIKNRNSGKTYNKQTGRWE